MKVKRNGRSEQLGFTTNVHTSRGFRGLSVSWWSHALPLPLSSPPFKVVSGSRLLPSPSPAPLWASCWYLQAQEDKGEGSSVQHREASVVWGAGLWTQKRQHLGLGCELEKNGCSQTSLRGN